LSAEVRHASSPAKQFGGQLLELLVIHLPAQELGSMNESVETHDGVYIERDCVIEHDGRRFESGGASVSRAFLIAYLGKNGVLSDWHGRRLGTYRITSTWRIHSWVSRTMHQVEAAVAGVTYTGRSCGVGMIYRGRRKIE
jgi:hypothetical protein